jgi:hypothetical protein
MTMKTTVTRTTQRHNFQTGHVLAIQCDLCGETVGHVNHQVDATTQPQPAAGEKATGNLPPTPWTLNSVTGEMRAANGQTVGYLAQTGFAVGEEILARVNSHKLLVEALREIASVAPVEVARIAHRALNMVSE